MAAYEWSQDAFVPTSQISVNNRGFLYGDGFFETMIGVEGVPAFWQQRKRRVQDACSFLFMKSPMEYDALLHHLVRISEVRDNLYARIRLTWYRAGGGKYHPENLTAGLIAHVEPLQTLPFNRQEAKTTRISNHRMPIDPANRHKLLSKHHQIRCAIEADQHLLQDLIILNTKDEVCETISGNVLVRMEGRWFTPPLSSGGLAGVVRSILLKEEAVEERIMKTEDLESAECLATSNSVVGLQELILNERSSDGAALKVLQEKLSEALISSVRDLRETLP